MIWTMPRWRPAGRLEWRLRCGVALIQVLLCLPRALGAQDSTAAQRFNQFIDQKLAGEDRWDRPKSVYAGAWDRLDSVLVEALNRSAALEQLRRVFVDLHGYRVADAKAGYAVLALPGAPQRVVATYKLWENLPGRFSVFEQKNGRWQQIAHIDTDDPVEVFPLVQARGAEPQLLTMETSQGADHSDGRASLWQTAARGITRYRDFGTFHDPFVSVANGEARLTHSELPPNFMNFSNSGPRLNYEMQIVPKSGGPTVSEVCTTPWMEAVARYYADMRSGRKAEALTLLHSPAVQTLLPADNTPLEDGSGDTNSGTGSVLFSNDAGFLRVQVNRERDGIWRIQSVGLGTSGSARQTAAVSLTVRQAEIAWVGDSLRHMQTLAASSGSAQRTKPSAAIALVRQLYTDFACEAVIDEPGCDARHELVDQPRAVLSKYFDGQLTRLWLADRERVTRTREVGNLDFSPIWDSQDPTGTIVHIGGTQNPYVVDVEVFHGPSSEKSLLRFTLVKTAVGLRIHDIARGSEWSLLSLLSRKP